MSDHPNILWLKIYTIWIRPDHQMVYLIRTWTTPLMNGWSHLFRKSNYRVLNFVRLSVGTYRTFAGQLDTGADRTSKIVCSLHRIGMQKSSLWWLLRQKRPPDKHFANRVSAPYTFIEEIFLPPQLSVVEILQWSYQSGRLFLTCVSLEYFSNGPKRSLNTISFGDDTHISPKCHLRFL